MDFELCGQCSKSLSELVDSVPWKWWAKYQEFDEQNARVEVVDLFHFLIYLAQTLGMTADDVYDAHTKKNKVNHARQDAEGTPKRMRPIPAYLICIFLLLPGFRPVRTYI